MIAIINQSTVVTDSEVLACVAALQIQVDRDFLPEWGLRADLKFFTVSEVVPPEAWQLVILDNADQAGALGYHDITASGQPLGKVFAKTTMDAGDNWTVTISHELLEMLLDPDIVECVTSLDGLTLYSKEACDACEDDSFGYQINGILVSDFVTRMWFGSRSRSGETKYDFQNKITAPFQLLSGGYIGVLDLSKTQGWTQLTARDEKARLKARAPIGSRRERRRIASQDRIPSTQ